MKEKIKKILKQFSFLILGIIIGCTATYLIARQGLWVMYGDEKYRHLKGLINTLEISKDETPSKARDKTLSSLHIFLDRIEVEIEGEGIEIFVSKENLKRIIINCKKRLKEKNIDLESIQTNDDRTKDTIEIIIKILNRYK